MANKITTIKQQVKRADRYSVYVNGKYACSFSEGELLKLGLHSGQELSEGELENLKDDSTRDKAYMRAIDLVSRRPRSEWELRDYLRRKDYSPEIIDTILNRLSNNGLVDDMDFAKRWVENRRLLKITSKRRLRQELKQKRINDDIIDQVIEEDETEERDVLLELVAKKQARYPDRQKFIRYLASQGFSYDDIRKVIEDI